ncbi:MAG: ferrous iron transport protein B [Candidatus Merdivicinus sp.]|jgi:ferrous iron transport protein B
MEEKAAKIFLEKRELPVIALAGNPNVGKSTVVNAITGLRQHTGNWAGKTVSSAFGRCTYPGMEAIIADLPGSYSLSAESADEQAARDFVCFENPDAVIIVCDAAVLERNLILALQILEVTGRAVLCVNLMDEAKRRGIQIDTARLSEELGIPVVATSARSGCGLQELMQKTAEILNQDRDPVKFRYLPVIEEALSILIPVLQERLPSDYPVRWLAMQMLNGEQDLVEKAGNALNMDWEKEDEIRVARWKARHFLEDQGFCEQKIRESATRCLVLHAEEICCECVAKVPASIKRDRQLDRIFTGKWTAIPMMLILLAAILWITIAGANLPSEWLSNFLMGLEPYLHKGIQAIQAPVWLESLAIDGIYHTLAWVISVMLPPMAIFFPLFTLLEDFGYLPRVAFNLDHCFQRAGACGRQCLTMLMGFGCNAVGVTGARIIDSPRERMIAILTNVFVPCNGRFPTLVILLTLFFAGSSGASTWQSALLLTVVILLGVLMTLLVSRILSKTLLKGVPSSFTLELPPYRKPQIGKVLIRSIFDRTIFVLGRAAAVAAPAGLVIWILANCTIAGEPLLLIAADFLDPFARLIGLDGILLLAFLLGFPANEIVLPIAVMAYTTAGVLTDPGESSQLLTILSENGWTVWTAVCTILFSLFHWPCSTTLWTIWKETHSIKWTVFAFLIPTAVGIGLCFTVCQVSRLFSAI